MTNKDPLPANALCQLAFWAKNMTMISGARMSWPGFSYSEAETARMSEMAASVSNAARQKFVLMNAVIFIALAAAFIFGFFLRLASWLFPTPAETKALPFVLLLAATALLTIGIGLPISMHLASRWSADETMRTGLTARLGDAALLAKVSYQINRMTLIMCGLLVPGTLLFIAFDIEGGPIITILKWAALIAMVAAVVLSRAIKPKQD